MNASLTATRTPHSRPDDGRAVLCLAQGINSGEGLVASTISTTHLAPKAEPGFWKRLPDPISA